MKDNGSPAWGLCETCKWWQLEPKAKATPTTVGYCIEETLQPFQLRVTGNSGCNKYMKGTPAHGKGSSEKPPTAVPARYGMLRASEQGRPQDRPLSERINNVPKYLEAVSKPDVGSRV